MRVVVFTQTVMVLIAMMIIMMFRQLAPFFFTVEHHKVLAERIESSYEYTGQNRKIGKTAARQGTGVCRFNDGVFRIETGKKRRTNQRQVTNQHGNPSNRHVLFQIAHMTHILIMVHANNGATGSQE